MKLAPLFLVLFSVVSCLPESLETEVEEAESKLVVSSQIIPNNIMVVTVTRSFSALEGTYGADLGEDDLDKFLVKNGLVILSYADRSDTLFTRDEAPGVYFSLFQLEGEGQEFDLYVYDSTSKESVTSKSTMLPRININEIEITREYTDLDLLYHVNYSFTDPEGTDNWYVMNLFNPDSVGSDLGANFSFEGESSVYTELISDKLYENNTIAINSEVLGFDLGDTVAVMLSNISEDYFRFLNARKRGGNIVSSLTGEPINHPTNVQGGYGYFNTHNPSIRQTIIKDK